MAKRKAEENSDDSYTVKRAAVTTSTSERPVAKPVQKLAPSSSLAVPTLPSLTPWTPTDIITLLPPLPPVFDSALENAAFTHAGMTTSPDEASYERLEWLGDSYIYIMSSILISSTFVTLLPGKCAQIREILVKNETLAGYARRYGFEERLRVPRNFIDDSDSIYRAKDRSRTKVLGDVFEAYVAAVIQSDSANGVQRVGTWLKSLWTVTIPRQIQDEYKRRDREKVARSGPTPSRPNLPAKDRLSQAIGCKGVNIRYKDIAQSKDDQNRPLFTVACYLESGLGQKDRLLASATAMGKSEAGLIAAQLALDDEKLMDELKSLKKQQVIAEKAATGLASSRWAD